MKSRSRTRSSVVCPGPRYDDARTGLVADLFEDVQAFDAVIEGHPGGMEPTIVIGSDRFMPQQVTVRARFEQRPVGGFRTFPQREGDGAVGPAATHFPDQSGQQFVVQSRVFSALEYECPATPAGSPLRSRPVRFPGSDGSVLPDDCCVECRSSGSRCGSNC